MDAGFQVTHLWGRRLPLTEPQLGFPRSHGACGVHIGRFVSNPEDVTCPDCLSIIEEGNK